jgi:prolyl-tRNA synthetase
MARTGDPCPRCASPLVENQGIEIGHVFKLGTKYSKAMSADYLDEKGQSHPIVMGCYGIGVNRILAAAVEAFHDANGIRWPLSLAPYQVFIAPMQVTNPEVMALVDRVAGVLEAAGVDVLVDDRDVRPGVKFKDADLIGFPLRVVVGERGLKEGVLETKWRDQDQASTVPLDSAGAAVLELLQARQKAEDSTRLDRVIGRAAARGIQLARGAQA